jgi:hypothetical protein
MRSVSSFVGPTLLVAMCATMQSGCFLFGRPLEYRTVVRNGSTASEFVAREQAGGRHEGRLGFLMPVSRSYLHEELAAQDIHPQAMGPLNQIRDRRTLLAVMGTFTRALGVQCNFCHQADNFAAPTPRKAVAAYMWDHFVRDLSLRDGSAAYCDSCHHGSPVFLRRDFPDRVQTLAYMREEYVHALRRRDGAAHGCTTCHGPTVNLRFLPRH